MQRHRSSLDQARIRFNNSMNIIPDAKYIFSDTSEKPDIVNFFIAQVTLDDEIYEGTGLSKKEAKSNCASFALDSLREKGILELKEKELEKKKAERDKKREEKLTLQKAKYGSEVDKKTAGVWRNALTKLNEYYPNIEFKVMAETPLKHTSIIAFTVVVHIDDKDFIGVGKSKRIAKLEAAEKALRSLNLWTEEDDKIKEEAINETESDRLQTGSFDTRKQKNWNGPQGQGWGIEQEIWRWIK